MSIRAVEGPESPFLVPFDDSFRVSDSPTSVAKSERPSKKALERRLEELVDELAQLQRVLYADDRWALLLVFQAMDAAGKDGTIRAMLSGVNPAGCQVFSFKQPSKRELDHDFLWRTTKSLPERGRIGVFNRSHYEEVLVVKVNPGFLGGQRLPAAVHDPNDLEPLWQSRYQSIRDHERHLANNGTMVLKFWLNVSREEQRERLLARLREPEKNWKFSEGDVATSQRWSEYMAAYEQALRQTSRPWAPWYAVPADNKRYMRVVVTEIVVAALRKLKLEFPSVNAERRQELAEFETKLSTESWV